MFANLASGNAGVLAFGFTVANMLESILAAWLLRTRAKCKVTFTDPSGLACFCMASTLGTATSATIGTIAAPAPWVAFWSSWFTTDLLGVLTVTPLLLIIARTFQRGELRSVRQMVPEMTANFALVGFAAAIAFAQPHYPLLFVPMLAVLVAVFRLGPVGAAGGVLIVAVVSSISLSLGAVPPLPAGASPLARSLFLQFYLVTLFAAALPVAALLAARGRLTQHIAGRMRLLELAESAAQVGHWRLDTATGRLTWSRQVFRIHGIDGDTPPALDAAIEAYHVDDRALVSAQVEAAIQNDCGFSFKARIVRPDGEIRHVFSRGEVDIYAGERSPGLFGILQDITDQVAHEAAIEEARIRAENHAANATIMAETDQLTGIANWRRTSAALDEAIGQAGKSSNPVSVAMFDIDHFKRVNDTFGHQVVDEVLKRVAADARGQLRSADTIGRFGGEEFVIVLPGATAGVAMMVAERVRIAVEEGCGAPQVTISIGVAELVSGETAEARLRRADQALYVAKREGRNLLRLAA